MIKKCTSKLDPPCVPFSPKVHTNSSEDSVEEKRQKRSGITVVINTNKTLPRALSKPAEKERRFNEKDSLAKVTGHKDKSIGPRGVRDKLTKKKPDSKTTKQTKKSKARSKTAAINTDLVTRTYNKTKQRQSTDSSQLKSANSRRRDTESFLCPEEISNHIDAIPEYQNSKEDVELPSAIKNFDNNGCLFVRGVPFWMLKDEAAPVVEHEPYARKLKEMVEGKFVLLNESTEPKDIDPIHDYTYMASRDYEYFDKPNKLISNTLRSLIKVSDVKCESKVGTSKDSSEDYNPSPIKEEGGGKVKFTQPREVILYDRKNYRGEVKVEKYTPGGPLKKIDIKPNYSVKKTKSSSLLLK